MSEHTPGKWTINGHQIVGEEDIQTFGRRRTSAFGPSTASYSTTVCEIHGDLSLPGPRANAEHILRACNAHEDLLAACEAQMEATIRPTPAGSAYALKLTEAAIAKARGTA